MKFKIFLYIFLLLFFSENLKAQSENQITSERQIDSSTCGDQLVASVPHELYEDAEDHTQVIRKNVEGQFDTTQIEMSGDPAKDAFRRGLIAGILKEDEIFISFEEEENNIMTLARVMEWNGNDIIFQIHRDGINLLILKRMSLLGWNTLFVGSTIDFWESIKVSSLAKDYFTHNDSSDDINHILRRNGTPLPDTPAEYHFLSKTSYEVIREMGNAYFEPIQVIDWTDPSLQRWMRKFTDMIKEKTGITPGAQELNAEQRSQIYHVWFNDIVPLIEDPNKSQYGHFRTLVCFLYSPEDHPGTYSPFLGYILDIKAAVCSELSEFGIILFSEYGLQTKFMGIKPPRKEQYGHAWIKVHGDGFVEFINSNGKEKIVHTDLNFLKELYPNLTDEEISSLTVEHDLVTPPLDPDNDFFLQSL